MEDQYGMADLRQYISSRPLFQQPPELISSHRPSHPYDMLIFRSDSTTSVTTNAGGGAASSSAAAGGCFSGFESGLNGGGGDGGAGRWPRQETLSLLEIRSRLDPRFKEANQKGPLWDEVSRIMYEENGYQRSGKKCREKFENLYKYYKKTKEGKAGRQDGKHYRFFRQLEALYGEPNNLHPNFHNPNTTLPTSIPDPSDTSLSLSNYSDADSISSDDTESEKTKKRGGKIRWKVKIKEFIDVQMKKLMDKQEAWMENMMRTVEHKEQERIKREEEWRREDAERVEREQKFWAREREWIEARDAALMEALHKLTAIENQNDDGRTAMEMKLQQRGATEEGMWEDKWENVNNCVLKCNKKRKENYFESNPSQGGSVYGDTSEPVGDDSIIRSVNDNGNSPPRNNTGNAMSESCFRYFMGDGYGRIMH